MSSSTGRRRRQQGLDGIDLRSAEVSIGYLGPGRAPSPQGDRSRMMTHFDVVPVDPGGRFTTPPLPPGRYYLDLFAYVHDDASVKDQPIRLPGKHPVRRPRAGDASGGDHRSGGYLFKAESAAPPPARDQRRRRSRTWRATSSTLKKEHEFNDRRWLFIIKVRDVQDKTLIDATFKHRVGGGDEFDLVIEAKKAERMSTGTPGRSGSISTLPPRSSTAAMPTSY